MRHAREPLQHHFIPVLGQNLGIPLPFIAQWVRSGGEKCCSREFGEVGCFEEVLEPADPLSLRCVVGRVFKEGRRFEAVEEF